MDLKERIKKAAEILARVAQIPQPPPSDDDEAVEQVDPMQVEKNHQPSQGEDNKL